MSAPPYMKLYIADYLADTTHLNCEQHGAYLLLLMAMWRAGGKLPNKDAKLAAIVGLSASAWGKIRPLIVELFIIRGSCLTHKRLAKEMRKYLDTSVNRSEAQKLSHSKKPRKNNVKSDDFVPQLLHNQNQNQKGRKELINSSFSSRQANAALRDEIAAASPDEDQLPRTPAGALDFAAIRERIDREAEAMSAKETA